MYYYMKQKLEGKRTKHKCDFIIFHDRESANIIKIKMRREKSITPNSWCFFFIDYFSTLEGFIRNWYDLINIFSKFNFFSLSSSLFILLNSSKSKIKFWFKMCNMIKFYENWFCTSSICLYGFNELSRILLSSY